MKLKYGSKNCSVVRDIEKQDFIFVNLIKKIEDFWCSQTHRVIRFFHRKSAKKILSKILLIFAIIFWSGSLEMLAGQELCSHTRGDYCYYSQRYPHFSSPAVKKEIQFLQGFFFFFVFLSPEIPDRLFHYLAKKKKKI